MKSNYGERFNITLDTICLASGIEKEQVIGYTPGDPAFGDSSIVLYRDKNGEEMQITVPLIKEAGAEIEQAILKLNKVRRTVRLPKYLDDVLRETVKKNGGTAADIIRQALVAHVMPHGAGGSHYYDGEDSLKYFYPLLYGVKAKS